MAEPQHTEYLPDIHIKEEIECKIEEQFDFYNCNSTVKLEPTIEEETWSSNISTTNEYDHLNCNSVLVPYATPNVNSLLNLKSEEQNTTRFNKSNLDINEAQLKEAILHSLNEIRSPVKLFKCDMCPKVYTVRQSLHKHKLTHSDHQPFKCNECDKKFQRKDLLKSHEAVHFTTRSFICQECNRSYKTNRTLTVHMMSHLPKADMPKCEVCFKTFTLVSKLKLHKRVHEEVKPYSCDLCDKTFTQKQSLENHGVVHQDVKPFQCEVCLKCFSQSGNLKQHLLTHTQEKPYPCDLCGKAFRCKSHVKAHKGFHCKIAKAKAIFN